MQPELWSSNRLAVELHRDRRSLAKILETIKPVESRRRGNGVNRFYHLAPVVDRLVELAAATTDAGDGGELDIHEARRRKTIAEMALAEINVEQKRGGLMSISTQEAAWGQIVQAIRGHLLALPHNLTAEVGGSPEQQQEILKVAHRLVVEALEELSGAEIEIVEVTDNGTEATGIGGHIGA